MVKFTGALSPLARSDLRHPDKNKQRKQLSAVASQRRGLMDTSDPRRGATQRVPSDFIQPSNKASLDDTLLLLLLLCVFSAREHFKSNCAYAAARRPPPPITFYLTTA